MTLHLKVVAKRDSSRDRSLAWSRMSEAAKTADEPGALEIVGSNPTGPTTITVLELDSR